MFAKKKQSKEAKQQQQQRSCGGSSCEASRSSHRRNSTSTNPSQNAAKRTSVFRLITKPPTIIRASEQSNNARKRRPPRPPPPKFNTSGCVAALSLDPPSYEEVLKADAKANRHKRPAPSLPQTSQNTWVKSANETVLISFDADEMPPTTMPATFHSQEFRELEDIFSDWTISQPNVSANNAANVLKPTRPIGNLNLLDDDIYVTGSDLFAERSAAEQTSQPKPLERPVPLPRSLLSHTSFVSDVVGNQNLKNTSRSRPTSNGNGQVSLCSLDEQPPSLPPRPVVRNSLIEVQELEMSEAPAIPPKPQNYFENSQGLDVDLSVQRSEPHGIAMFDYTASQNDELTFKINDTIVLIHRLDNNWFYGCRGEHEGMFPRSFIHVVIPLPDDPEFQNEGDALMSGPRCLAMFDYVGSSNEELSFHVGDMISLVARIGEHWFMGEHKGNNGLVPSNYVRVLEDLPTNGSSICEASVLHDFKAELPSELDCKAGEQIIIISPVDKDWVKARNGSNVGIVPWTYLDFSV